MTVNGVSKLTGVSIRTLQYYDKIGLLKPTKYTQSGYRLYDDIALEKLQQILLFRELEFSLKDINKIINNPSFDKDKALEQQIDLLTLKREHIENLIDLARGIKTIGVKTMDFSAFNNNKIDDYKKQAKQFWGDTPQYKEYEGRSKDRTKKQSQSINIKMMSIFAEFGTIRGENPGSAEAQRLVKRLQDFITENFYTCSDEMLVSLGEMYADGGEFTANIDAVGGIGTAEFAHKAIDIYCK